MYHRCKTSKYRHFVFWALGRSSSSAYNMPLMRTRSLSMALGLLAGVFLVFGAAPSYGQVDDIVINGEPGSGNANNNTLGNDAGWRMLGPPVQGATPVDLTSPQDALGSVIEFDLPTGDKMFYEWDDSAGDFTAVTDSTVSSSFENGRGYILFLFDDDGTPNSDPLDSNLTLEVESGTAPGNTAVTVGLNTGSNFHLLANPYDVAARANRIDNAEGNNIGSDDEFSTTIQIWNGGDSSGEGDASQGSYCMFDITSNGTNVIDGQYADANSCNNGGQLSSWQAFFLEQIGSRGDTEVTFARNSRTNKEVGNIVGDRDPLVNSNTSLAKVGRYENSDGTSDHVRIGLSLEVENSEGAEIARDVASALYFHSEATAGMDSRDASKLTPLTYPYAVIGPVGPTAEGDTAIKAQESRPLDQELPLEVPLRLQTEGQVEGTATIQGRQWSGVPSDWTITLIDTKGTSDPSDDVEHELTGSGSNGYEFTIGGENPGTSSQTASMDPPGRRVGSNGYLPDKLSLTEKALEGDNEVRTSAQQSSSDSTRFVLRVSGSPLPVELAAFDATLSSESATLQWTTASETNNAGFEVQRRGPEAEAFTPLGFVESRADGGTTQNAQQYQFETDALEAGRHVFRLRQVDTDGSATLSDTTAVEVSLGAASEVEVAPNPVQTEATVTLRVRSEQNVSAGLYDMLGRKVRTLHEGRMAPRQAHRLSLDANGLTSGAYLLRVQGERFETTRRVTIVQ